jgi:uncharacterized membrane protein YvbJ
MTYCERCGAKNRDDAEFCEQCGASLHPSPARRRGRREEREMCFGVPGRFWPIILGIIIILTGIGFYFEVEIFPLLLILFAILIIAGAVLRPRRR